MYYQLLILFICIFVSYCVKIIVYVCNCCDVSFIYMNIYLAR